MTVTTSYGSWYNHTGSNLTPSADIQDVMGGADSDWLQRMEDSGAIDDIERDWREAINEALPEGITLAGEEFYGPHDSDPDYTDEIQDCDIREIINAIDLQDIIERHDVDLTFVPQVTAGDIRTLLGSTAEEPVLYLKLDEDSGQPEELDVWAAALVPHGSIITTRADALNLLGDEPDEEMIAPFLLELQQAIDGLVAERG